MAKVHRAAAGALLLASLILAGCSGESAEGIFTGSLANNTAQQKGPDAKVDPVCVSLVARIDQLRREGIGDKIEKAAAKRYKMTHNDLTKADQLVKANADFQLRCSTITPGANNAALTPEPAAAPVKTARNFDFAGPGNQP
jgi:hypothetical protein